MNIIIIIIIIYIFIIHVAVSSPLFSTPGFPLLWYSPGGGEAVYIIFRPYFRCIGGFCPGHRIASKGSFLTIGSLATPSFFIARVIPPYIRGIFSPVSIPSIRALLPPTPSFRSILPSFSGVISSIRVSSLVFPVFSRGSIPS